MRPTAVALFVCVIVAQFLAAETLFPTPIHLTRQVADPISGKTTVIEEYGYGNRLVAVAGARTSIADYEKGELTEIDRDAATYSITPFETIAKTARQYGPPVAARTAGGDAPAAARSQGMRTTKSGRPAEIFAIEIDGADLDQTIELAVDRSTPLSREALEVLLGAAYPGVRRPEHDAILAAAAPERTSAGSAAKASAPAWGLPLEQITTIEMDGQTIEIRTSVLRVGQEPPPPDLVMIPAGARLVVSRLAAVNQALEDVDRVVPPPPLP